MQQQWLNCQSPTCCCYRESPRYWSSLKFTWPAKAHLLAFFFFNFFSKEFCCSGCWPLLWASFPFVGNLNFNIKTVANQVFKYHNCIAHSDRGAEIILYNIMRYHIKLKNYKDEAFISRQRRNSLPLCRCSFKLLLDSSQFALQFTGSSKFNTLLIFYDKQITSE